ncbi:MAG: type III-B CRISPR-associated protein Cas10/Cmr2 [Thermodesulfobacteriota bacterium]|nr:type III-B CRISPR-associated protein Cas10/Cmr2 [Thermodesulfobacteriota bacterium]
MNTSGCLWDKKIEAYLLDPPDIALFPDGAETRGRELIDRAFGVTSREISSEAQEAHEIACGLDIPPFLPANQKGVFGQEPLLIHPLSGEKYRLPIKIGALETDKIKGILLEAVQKIRQEVEGSQKAGMDCLPKRLFLSLWRLFADKIRVQEKETKIAAPLGPYWDLLPADPRIPSHSIWDHSSIAAAFAGALPDPAIIIFTVGSAQEFVSSARRTQDFWMGSFMLSFLMWEAIRVFAEECGPDCLVYPSLKGQPLVDRWLWEKGIPVPSPTVPALQIANLPNMFTAIVPKAKVQVLAANAKEAMIGKWKEIAGRVKAEAEKAVSWELGFKMGEEWEKIWGRQIDDLLPKLGFFWASCPWGDPTEILQAYQEVLPPDDEAPARRKFQEFKKIIERCAEKNYGMMYPLLSPLASRALTARKNLRDFEQKEEPGEKCTLCGLREALHPGYPELRDWVREKWPSLQNAGDYPLLRKFWEELSRIEGKEKDDIQKFKGRIRRGERLCSVCLTKRLALEAYFEEKKVLNFDRHLFPSTASIATAPFKREVIKEFRGEGLLKNYVESVRKFLDKHRIFYPSSPVPALEALKDEFEGKDKEIVGSFLRIDGDWLFEESFDADKIKREFRIMDLDEKSRGKAVNALKELRNAAKEKNISPSRYYAVLAMDGDKMGNWVAGHFAPLYEWMFHPQLKLSQPLNSSNSTGPTRPLGPASHMALSSALKNFALEMTRPVVEEMHCGKLIYAGGDDLLAFVPVTDLLPVMRKIRSLFQGCSLADGKIRAGKGWGEVSRGSEDKNFLLMGEAHNRDGIEFEGPTASLGAAVVHESHPLSLAIEEAFSRAMKDHAKENLGRDAFAIVFPLLDIQSLDQITQAALIPDPILTYAKNYIMIAL